MKFTDETNKKIGLLLKSALKSGGLRNLWKVAAEFYIEASKIATADSAYSGLVKGTVCEDVCILALRDIIKRHGYVAKVYHSMTLPNVINTATGDITELDVLVVSESFIMTIECKSYMGNLRVLSPCTLSRSSGKNADVYKQTEKHVRLLKPYVRAFAKKKSKVDSTVFGAGFVMSNGTIRDDRGENDRRRLPILIMKGFESFIVSIFNKYTDFVYRYDVLVEVFDKMDRSVKGHKMHQDYLGYTR